MLRLNIVIPISLLSSLANAPALGEYYTSHCAAAPASPRCEAERARPFTKARNAEINASIARVNAARLALSTTYCKTPYSTTPRCEAERARQFAKARNAEINASIAKVAAVRSFEKARNAEINASIAAVKRERARAFAAARNAEINASIAAVEREHARAFVAARNAEIDASIAKVKAVREAQAFAAARNAEINASIAAVERARAREFAAARNAEIDASIAKVKAVREAQAFAAARNAEINASMLVVRAQRALRLALAARRSEIETGAIKLTDMLGKLDQAPVVRRTHEARHLGPCREATHLINPLQFTDGNAEIEEAMKPELDRIAMMALTCSAIHIELHGYSDNSGPAQINRHLAQRRAQAVAEYLIQSRVMRSRLTTIGHAATQPVVPNSSDVNRALNRRVEVTINDPAKEAAAQRVIWDLAAVLDPAYMPPRRRLSP